MKRIATLLLVLFLTTIFGCTVEKENDPVAASPAGWRWMLDPDGKLTVSFDNRILLEWLGVEADELDGGAWMLFGFFHFWDTNRSTSALVFQQDGDALRLVKNGHAFGAVTFTATNEGGLRVSVRLNDASAQALRLRFHLRDDDRFWGFGEQYNFLDFRGRRVPIWVSEQGVGRSENPLLPFQGKLTDSYFPMPYFVDPLRGFGFLLENTEYALFDLGAKEADVWSSEVWNGREVSFLLLPGPRPALVVQQLTAAVGRPQQPPPDWAFDGVWLAAQGGPAVVRERLAAALSADVTVTAMWVQDWLGRREFGLGNAGVKYHWTADEELYPDLAGLIAELRAQGVRFLGYFNPFVTLAYDQWEEAVANGYLIERTGGTPYIFPIVTFAGSLLDVTNPAAGDWFQGFAREAVAYGMSGWMADFGEWLPYDAGQFDGDAPRDHNLYPEAWHRLNREVLEEAYPDGDYVMFTRSGYTGEQRVAQIVWAGDQEATWSALDGLPTVVTAGLTAGLAGVPFFTHDIAGFSGGPSTKELFMRWTELGAFTPVMRTHEGLQSGVNHRFDSDAETLAHFSLFARIHRALAPYFLALAQEAVEQGLPMIRHTVLVDPEWPAAYTAGQQWMLGNDLLIAPVVTEGATSVTVYLPDGEWQHLLTDESHSGRQVIEVDAPLGRPAVFVRKGKLTEIRQQVREWVE